MEKIQKNLVVIDYQNDFVALDGLLTCGESAINIESSILSLVDKYKGENIFVTFDTHYENDFSKEDLSKEAEIYPMHCVFGTPGHDLYGKLKEKMETIEHKKIYKNSFGSEKLAKKILENNDPNEEILVEFCGVSTNVCVMQNVIILHNYFVANNIKFSIIINKNAVASFDDEKGAEALSYLKDILGVKIVN